MNKELLNRIITILVLIFLAGSFVYWIAYLGAKDNDLEGPQIAYTECTVTDSYSRKPVRGKAHNTNHYVVSSCGTFQIEENVSTAFEIGQDYDWSATQGNWANKPTILTAEESY